MALDANDAITQLVIFAGVVLGVVAWTLWQYLKTKSTFAEFDIQIVFDKKFLGTAVGALIAAFILVSGSFNAFLDKVIAQDPATYIAAFFGAFGLGFTFNAVGNQLIPSPANPDAQKVLEERKAARVLALKGIDLEKVSNMVVHDEEQETSKTE